MKILMVSDLYPPFIGGSYRYAQTLSRALSEKNHEVLVFTIGNEDQPFIENDCGVKVIRFKAFFQRVPFLFKDNQIKYPPPASDYLACRMLESIIRVERPDIVHVHGWLLYSVLKLKKKLDFPLVVTLHDHGLICPKIILYKNNHICCEPFTFRCIICARESFGLAKSSLVYYSIRSQKNKLALVDKFISVSSFTKRIYSRYLNLGSKIDVVPNFFDDTNQKSELATHYVFPDEFILFVGLLAPCKGVEILLRAYNELDTKVKLVLIGVKDPDYSYKTTERVKIIENAPHEIVMEACSKCKFLVAPSIFPEPCPTVILEAMSRKKAVIATETGGLPDIVVNGNTGIVVSPNDSVLLANAMKLLLQEPKVTLDMGLRGYRRYLLNYSVGANLPRIQKIYKSLIQR